MAQFERMDPDLDGPGDEWRGVMQKQLMMMVCAGVGVAICATAAISAEDLVAAVKERRDLMKKTVAPAAKLGGQMVKGVKPFDAAEAAKAMNDISGVPDKYVTLFPKGTEHGESPIDKFPIRMTKVKPNRRSGRTSMTSRRSP